MAEASSVTLAEVHDALTARIRSVMALDGEIPSDARFDEDLHADSLDLVEVIEGVERDLSARRVTVTLGDDELLALRTVGEAARRIHDNIAAAGEA